MLRDAQWAVLKPLVERCRQHAKVALSNPGRTMGAILRRPTNGAKWRRAGRAGTSSGATRWLPPCETDDRRCDHGGRPPNFHPLVEAGCVGALVGAGAGAPRATRHDVPRRHQRARAPEGCRRGEKDGTRAQRGASEALDHSRGGCGHDRRCRSSVAERHVSLKGWRGACVIADGAGRAVAFRISHQRSRRSPVR